MDCWYPTAVTAEASCGLGVYVRMFREKWRWKWFHLFWRRHRLFVIKHHRRGGIMPLLALCPTVLGIWKCVVAVVQRFSDLVLFNQLTIKDSRYTSDRRSPWGRVANSLASRCLSYTNTRLYYRWTQCLDPLASQPSAGTLIFAFIQIFSHWTTPASDRPDKSSFHKAHMKI